MILEKGSQICGFTVTAVQQIEELGVTLFEMVHDKTGAQLAWCDSKVQNKLFSVALKTIPFDSTGVFHILEHSVFCGSKKYPVKDPFVYLMKTSMNTFLNAMTFPDKTLFPVSSKNERDFLNLTSVYLDAVFNPSVLENPNIFYQEGVHTEINENVPSYKGVVFNEMKGAMSTLEDKIEYGMNSLLFPDTCYRFNSGGDPAVIPDLTYDSLVKTYKKFYHPSNAKFFLDGDIPLEKTLSLIDKQLENYGKLDVKQEIELQQPKTNEGTLYYEIGQNENDDRKAVLTLSKIIGTWKDKTRLYAAKILCDVLAETNESPLKRAVLSSGLADDMEMYVIDGIAQPYIAITVRGMNDSDSGKIKHLIFDTIKQIIDVGLDRKSVDGSINRMYFHSKQQPEPQGLNRAISCLASWLYGDDLTLYLKQKDTLSELRNMAQNGQFEALLSELLTNENGICALHTLPSKTLGELERKTEEERLNKEISALDENGKKELIKLNENLTLWQQSDDSDIAAKVIPTLDLSSISDMPELIKTEETKENGITILRHPIETEGIIYFTLYFPLTNFSLDELKQLSILPSLFAELPTENYSADELQKEIKTVIGALSFDIGCFGDFRQTEQCTPYLVVSAGALEENFAAAKKLIAEILTKTRFDCTEKIKELVAQYSEIARQDVIGGGHAIGLTAVRAHYSAKNAVNEATGGFTSVKFIRDFNRNFSEQISGFLDVANRALNEAISKAGLIVSSTTTKKADFSDLFNLLPAGKKAPATAAYKTDLPEKMGICIPSQVSYAEKGYNLYLCGEKPTGSVNVASTIISLCYLWDKIRVQNGAYGTGFTSDISGGIGFYSYRDPSASASIEIYDNSADFIREFCESDEEMDGYIISSIASSEGLMSPARQGATADSYWLSGYMDQDKIDTRRQMLCASREDLMKLCPVMEKMAQNGAVCVVGSEDKLKECGELTIFEL